MASENLKLVKKKKKKRISPLVPIGVMTLVLIGSIVFFVATFSVKEIKITGNYTYSRDEIIDAIEDDLYIPNVLCMMGVNKIFKHKYQPFIENVEMTFPRGEHHVLLIKVKEKLRAGVFSYMNKYVYFNSAGYAMESRNTLFEGVPVVTGIEYDKMVLGDKIPVDDSYFKIIVSITKKIATYGLDISEISFDEAKGISLFSGRYEIYLGDASYLEEKMSRIQDSLESVKKVSKKGVINMQLVTSEKNTITFSK